MHPMKLWPILVQENHQNQPRLSWLKLRLSWERGFSNNSKDQQQFKSLLWLPTSHGVLEQGTEP